MALLIVLVYVIDLVGDVECLLYDWRVLIVVAFIYIFARSTISL